jgi:hypothetical protein
MKWILAVLCAAIAFAEPTAEQIEFFEKQVRPVLAKNCNGCHNQRLKSSGLDLSSAGGFAAGGPSGALVDQAHPEMGLLWKVTTYDDKLKMPPSGKMKAEDLATLQAWMKMGAPFPGASAQAAVRKPTGKLITDSDRSFWSFQPVKMPAIPTVRDAVWGKSAVDRFILAKLEQKDLKPAATANKMALLRRVTFDLTGLPPTSQELSAFLADESPEAFAKVIDRLLASPRYGEKWGRHWLDLARYADSTGNDEDHRYPHAWRYRDYVINAFNDDKPYNEFIREQIAGDLLPSKDGSIHRDGIVATGFLALGAKAIAQQDKQKMLYDVYDEQIDVVSKSVLGLTIACARCHDHKFDPILTRDYYSLAGIFASTKSFAKVPGTVSQLLFVPLVRQTELEKDKELRFPAALKRREADALEQLETLRVQRLWGNQLAQLMSQAKPTGKAAELGDSDDEELQIKNQIAAGLHGVTHKFLAKTPESRPYLDDWYANPTAATAAAYQKRFMERFVAYENAVIAWRQEVSKLNTDYRANLPKAPNIDKDAAFQDPFFQEVMKRVFNSAKRSKEFRKAAVDETVKKLRDEARAQDDAIPQPDMACAVAEGSSVDQKVFVRGDYNSLGEPAPKAMPTVLTPTDPNVSSKGSGRLELANWLASDQNPLTARVMVNRIWQGHFGEGIVRSPDNFGKMGEQPTHPELLDYLATKFMSAGWSIKQLHREILLSNAYQMSTSTTEAALTNDPENRLFSRFPRRRLTVEEMRDSILSLSGTIDLTMGGTLQKGTGTDGENSEGRLSIKPETSTRRMVYLPLRRANLPSMLNLFDFGDATTTSGKRVLTNVAPQALFMMNSEFVDRAAGRMAEVAGYDVAKLYLKVVNRPAERPEIEAAQKYLADHQQRFKDRTKAWKSFSKLLLVSNEFMYLD